MIVRDTAAASARQVTAEGFLRVRARIGRTGIHHYRAAELGQPPGFAPGDTVRVWRPPEEVFAPASLASFAAKPVTDAHPAEMVDAGNWRRYAVGHAGETVAPDGDHVAAELLITDAATAARALAGAELSNGYFADFDFTPGETPDGERYDAVQRNIRGNHIAVVDQGRCGESCRIGDAATRDCGCGCGCGGTAPADAGLAADIEALRGRLAALEAGPAQSARDAVAQTDPGVLDALVAERTDAIEAARRAFGPAFDPTGRSLPDIRRLVVARALGDARVDARGDAYVAAAFDTLLAARASADPLALHLAQATRDAGPRPGAALAARNLHLATAWRGEPHQGAL